MEYIMDLLKNIGIIIASLGAIPAFLVAINYKNKRDKVALVGSSFVSTVNKLSSTNETERMSGAILLRRFFDVKTEMGDAQMPYADEAVNVIAASLRTLPANNFQKVLADSLAYAPSLQNVDLQKTNLQNAYLGLKNEGAKIDLSGADFYRADLSNASFKGAMLRGAKFYQAQLYKTVLKEASLEKCNFYGVDIMDTDFREARLDGANFENAINIPDNILEHLDEKGIYREDKSVIKKLYSPQLKVKIFVSKPSIMTSEQASRYDYLVKLLKNRVDVEILEKKDYHVSGALGEISKQIEECKGVVTIGFEQFAIKEGDFRLHTNEHCTLTDTSLATPWNHIEAGMAAMKGIEILALADDGVNEGIFDENLKDAKLTRAVFPKELNISQLQKDLNDWFKKIEG